MTDSATLYERLGGEDAIAAVVEEFYERVLADDQLAPYFEGTDMAAQRAHQTQFLSAVAGGPVEYSGESMREAHAHLEIDHEDFMAVAGHLQASLEAFDVPGEEVDEVVTAVAGLEDEVVTA